jgi:hypothetical protein
LWHYRRCLFLHGKHLSQDRKPINIGHFYN